MRNFLVVAQTITFFGLALVLVADGVWKLAVAQGLLGCVTVLVYW